MKKMIRLGFLCYVLICLTGCSNEIKNNPYFYDAEEVVLSANAEYQEDSPKYVYLEGEIHEILEENIASGSPYSVYDNAALCEVLKDTLEDGEWIAETCDSFFVAEYFVFDFNGDGEEDYLVSLAGAGYHGTGGNSVSIFFGRRCFAGGLRRDCKVLWQTICTSYGIK